MFLYISFGSDFKRDVFTIKERVSDREVKHVCHVFSYELALIKKRSISLLKSVVHAVWIVVLLTEVAF